MKLISTGGKSTPVSFAEATKQGLASDGGLFYPAEISEFRRDEITAMRDKTFPEIALAAARLLLGSEIPEAELERIVRTSLTFPVPLHVLDGNISVLELFHGPTLAFKDFGARFMARALEYFHKGENRPMTVLVATSGDTGSAVGQGFAGVEGIDVVILFPSGRVSQLQEQQLTTIGGNVTALEVDGTFDDCQRLVKGAFGDRELATRLQLTSANSINIARLIPQTFYYFEAVARASATKDPVMIAVPCGNLGNLTAGLIARKMGLPIKKFVGATNANRLFVDYLEGKDFVPRKAVPTISNAMDVGDPSNLARIKALFPGGPVSLKEMVVGDSLSDTEILQNIALAYKRSGYILDPHAAAAYGALRRCATDSPAIVLGTAHPAKFLESYESGLRERIEIPEALKEAQLREKRSVRVSNHPEEFKALLLAQ